MHRMLVFTSLGKPDMLQAYNIAYTKSLIEYNNIG